MSEQWGLRPRVLLSGAVDAECERQISDVAEVVLAPDSHPDTLRKLIVDVDVLVVRSPLPSDLFDHAPRLKGVVRYGVGVDMIPMDAANARRLPVANVPGSNRHAVSEHAMGALFLLRRRTMQMDALIRTKGWYKSRTLTETAEELHGQVLGIVGVGEIGTRIAEIAHHGYGMRILGHQRRLETLPSFVTASSLDDLLTQSDAVVLSCPLNESTRGLISSHHIGLMPSHSILINVARGEIIDETALIAALRDRKIAGAALDVFRNQPLPTDHPLLAFDNAVLTPHAAGLTWQSMRLMGQGTAEAVRQILNNQLPQNIVNSESLQK